MSLAGLQTPQKPLPGAFVQTPAPSRYQTGADPRRQLFRSQSLSGQQSNGLQMQSSTSGQQEQQISQIQSQPQAPPLLPVQRAARTVNEALQRDANFPDLDSYVKRKYSFATLKLKLTLKQRESRRTMTLRKIPHGRPIRGRKCTTFPTKYLSNITMRKFQQ
jgi:hypothetical protein